MDPQTVSQLADELAVTIGNATLLRNSIASGLIVLALWFIQRALKRYLNKSKIEPGKRYHWAKAINYTISIAGILGVTAVWWDFLGSLATILALLIAGLAVALRDPISSLAGWGFIMWRHPFSVGDRIEMAGVKGDVIDITWFTFSMMELGVLEMGRQPTGRVIHMPNSWIFTKYTANETQEFAYVWQEIPVTITFESNWKKADRILGEIAERYGSEIAPTAKAEMEKATTKFLLSVGQVDPKVYTRVVSIGIELTIRLVTEARKRRDIEEAIWEAVLDAFAAEPDIDFAYPTQRIYFNPQEGKPGVGGSSPG